MRNKNILRCLKKRKSNTNLEPLKTNNHKHSNKKQDMLDLLLDNDSIRPFLRSGVQRSQLERLREMLTNEDSAEGFLASTYANINQLVLFVTKVSFVRE